MKSKKLMVLLFISIFLLSAFISGYIYLDKINTVEISKKDEDLGITKEKSKTNEEKKETKNEIINIALFGGDKREKYAPIHSDAIMILSIDTSSNSIKLSSIMRDTYVNIHGHGMDKINHAYAFGGPELAIRTLNENFNLNIRDYAFVDFFGFEDIVDSLGGIEVDVKKYEVREINKYIKEVANIKNERPTLIDGPGTKKLNGSQALAYSRIRKVGNGDFERTDRQRKVMELLFESALNVGVTKYPKLVDSILPHMETSLSKMDIIKIGTQVLGSNIKTIEQNRFPQVENCQEQRINGISYIVSDLDETERDIHNFIYGEIEQCKLD